MNRPVTDLLPAIFDEIVSHYERKVVGFYTRDNIVNELLNGIINAVADSVQDRRKLGDSKTTAPDYTFLTNDRLSGINLSRRQLVERMQMTVPLSAVMLEVALLLIEAQVDLSLGGPGTPRSFTIRGITFTLPQEQETDIASWCQTLLQSVLQGVSHDPSSFWLRATRHRPEGLRILVEGLQMSATLRRAVPYKISVEDYLIDPLVKDHETDPQIRVRVLHVSDLHLVKDITEEGRRKIKPALVASHAFGTTSDFGLAVGDLKPRYNLVLATGDLTTDGARDSFETVLRFMRSDSMSGTNPMRIATYGLHASRGDRLLLPGNHDRFGNAPIPGQHANAYFEEVLGTPLHYPYVRGYRPEEENDNSLTLLFFVFDSNLPKCPEPFDIPGRVRAIAKGEVTENDITEAFDRLAKVIVDKKEVTDLYGKEIKFDPKKTVRIAVLHHHPILSAEAEKEAEQERPSMWKHPLQAIEWRKSRSDETLMAMDGGASFLAGCLSAGVQLVLFGHQHEPYYRLVGEKKFPKLETPFGEAPAAIHCFCCASTLEHTASKNGFYVFDFFDETHVSVDLFLSERHDKKVSGPFAPVPEGHRVIDLSKPDQNASDVKWISRSDFLRPTAPVPTVTSGNAISIAGGVDPAA